MALLQRQADASPTDGEPGTRYVLDVLLYCAKREEGSTALPVPPKEGQKGEMVVCRQPLSTLCSKQELFWGDMGCAAAW